jgi:hypothetical protein
VDSDGQVAVLMIQEAPKQDGAQVCEACGNWTEEPCSREEAVAEFGFEIVKDIDDGEPMLICADCL